MNRPSLVLVVFTSLLGAALTALPAAGQTPNGSATCHS